MVKIRFIVDMAPEPFTAQLLEAINEVRTNPSEFVKHLEEFLALLEDDFVYKSQNGKRVKSKKGKAGQKISFFLPRSTDDFLR